MKKEHILRKNLLRYVINEKRFLAAIRHPFITYMMYYTKDLCNLYFIMPFAVGGDLFGLIQKNGVLGELKSRFYSGQIVLALEYLHTMDILYRWLSCIFYVAYNGPITRTTTTFRPHHMRIERRCRCPCRNVKLTSKIIKESVVLRWKIIQLPKL